MQTVKVKIEGIAYHIKHNAINSGCQVLFWLLPKQRIGATSGADDPERCLGFYKAEGAVGQGYSS